MCWHIVLQGEAHEGWKVAEVDHTMSVAALTSQELSHADPEDSVADDDHQSQCSIRLLCAEVTDKRSFLPLPKTNVSLPPFTLPSALGNARV